MLADVVADADLVRAEHCPALRHRDAPRDLVVDHGPLFERSLLCSPGADGCLYVFGFKDDANVLDGPATADDDENHAPRHGGDVHDFADFQRPGSVYSHQQRDRDRPAVVLEQDASGARSRKAHAREEVLRKSFREANAAGNIRTPDGSRTHSRWEAGPASDSRGPAPFSGEYGAGFRARAEGECALNAG